MNEFDDATISDALTDRVAVGDVGIEGALHAVNLRATATRRRRAAAAGFGAMTGVVLLATAALATRSPDVVRTPNDSGVPAVSEPVIPTDVAPTTAPPTSTPVNSTDVPAPSSSVDTAAPTSVGTPAPTQPAVIPPPATAGSTPASTAPVATAPASTAVVTTGPASTAPDPTTTAPAAPSTSEPDHEPATPSFGNRVYSSGGGSITVSWDGTALSLGGTLPAAGYAAEVEDQRSDRIRVRFTGPDDWRIEVRADDDGVVTSSVSS